MGELFKVIGFWRAAWRFDAARLRRRRPHAHGCRGRMRWLLVFLLAFLVFNGLQGWLRRIGLGRLPGDFSFRLARPRVVPAAGQQPGAEPDRDGIGALI
jgi:hypothetical protein